MVEQIARNVIPLSHNPLMNILSYLDAKQIFKDKVLFLNKRVSGEKWLIKEVAARHLGIIEDTKFE